MRVGPVPTPLGRVYLALVLLTLAIVVLAVYIVALKNARDTETTRIHDQLVHNNCALMDQLPAGGPLDRLRATYHCGPGLPASTAP